VASAGADEVGGSEDSSQSSSSPETGSTSSSTGSGGATAGSSESTSSTASSDDADTSDTAESSDDASGGSDQVAQNDGANGSGSSSESSGSGGNSGNAKSQQEEKRPPFDTYDSEGMHNEFHKKHAGEIVFSDRPISKDPNEGQIKSSFSLDDKLYTRSFLEDSAVNIMRKDGFKQMAGKGKLYMEVKPVSWSDDKWIRSDNSKHLSYKTAAGRKKTIIQFQEGSYLDQDRGETYYVNGDAPTGFKFFVGRLLPRLPKGESVEVEMRLVYYFLIAEENPYGSVDDFTQTIAKGKLELKNVTPQARAKLYRDHGPKLPSSKHPRARRLEPETLERVEEEWDGEGVKASFPETGWDIEHGPSGPVERTLPAYVIHKEDGKCEWVSITIYQDYAGGGRYTNEVTEMAVGRDRGPILCPQ
jgi:hypothetical protein